MTVWDISNKRKQLPEEQTNALCIGTSSPFIKPSRTVLRLKPEVVPGSSDACFILCEIYLIQTISSPGTCGG